MGIGSEKQAAGFSGKTPPGPRGIQFDELVAELREALGPSSGLDSSDVDVDSLARLMRKYDGTDYGWARYEHRDGSRGYTRNLVDKGNGKSNLVGAIVCRPLLTNRSSSCSYGVLGKAAPSTTMAMPTVL